MIKPYTKLTDIEIQMVIMSCVMPDPDDTKKIEDLGEHYISEEDTINHIETACKLLARTIDDETYSYDQLYNMIMPARRRIVTNINRLIGARYLAVSWNPDTERYSTLSLNDGLVDMVRNYKIGVPQLIEPNDTTKVLMKMHDIHVFTGANNEY